MTESVKTTQKPFWTPLIVRVKSAILMYGAFGLFISGGAFSIFLLGIIVQVMMFKEVIAVGYARYNKDARFVSLHWYWFFTSLFYFNGRMFLHELIKSNIINNYFIRFSKYHLSVSYALLILGIVMFVFTLKKPYYMKQFKILSMSIALLFLIQAQIFLFYKMMRNGIIWVIFPIAIICLNDSSAYFVGKFMGRTPLTELSPKKTVEGFVGAAIITSLISPILATIAIRFNCLLCPSRGILLQSLHCQPDPIFLKAQYTLPYSFLPAFIAKFSPQPLLLHVSPFEIHSFFIGLLISFIGPFGGFLASGFKRAFLLKDFGNIIPGHGGFTDRLDCLPLVATTMYFYKHTFMNFPEIFPEHVFAQFMKLSSSDKTRLVELVDEFIER